jgi:hypothetical protein
MRKSSHEDNALIVKKQLGKFMETKKEHKEETIHEALNRIQKELKAPKEQKNAFQGYKYRSCEDILEAVKPLLGKTYLTIEDEIVLVGDRYYVKATATLSMGEKTIQTTAFAREALDKKNDKGKDIMDVAQITGASSSYARKYALNGWSCIDDTKDPDSTNTHGKEETQTVQNASKPPFGEGSEIID